MYDSLRFKGVVNAILKDQYGNIKQDQTIYNTTTFYLDNLVASYLAVGSATVIGSPGISYMAVGSGTGRTATSSGLANGINISILSGTTFPQQNGSQVIFNGYWPAGSATGSITEAGVFRSNSFTAGSMICYTDAISVQKGASDSLTITWTLNC